MWVNKEQVHAPCSCDHIHAHEFINNFLQSDLARMTTEKFSKSFVSNIYFLNVNMILLTV